MTEKDVTISIPAGLTAKTVTVIVEKANSFSSSIVFESDHRRVNGKSLLGVLSLGIVGGTNIRIIADGNDEAEAVDGLVALVESGFAE